MPELREIIDAQRKGKETLPEWTLGEQLLDIASECKINEELITRDVQVEGMTLSDLAKKLKAYADEQHRKLKGNVFCITPAVADGIIREFYGLAKRDDGHTEAEKKNAGKESGFVDLADFI